MPIKIVVPISGGKDSEACLKLALETYAQNDVIGLFCDTGWEHPLTYEHIAGMTARYSVKIERIQAGTVPEQILKTKRFPAPLIRFCTSELKIVPSKRFYADLMRKQQTGFEVWCGMRSAESGDRERRYHGKVANEVYFPHVINEKYPKYLGKGGVRFRLPILHWSTQDVFTYLNGSVNPLYSAGFDRVGCFPCLASNSKNQSNAFNFDDFGANQKRIIMELEDRIGKKHEPGNTDQMCMFCHI